VTYRIAQDYDYVGKDYWRWRAWIEADPEELDKVTEVVWILHPTFPRARIPIKDRSTNFRLETAGWGTFLLRAEVELADGDSKSLKHPLRLEYPDEKETAPSRNVGAAAPRRRPPTVFLSYSMEDLHTAAKVRDELQKADFKVLDQTQLREGEHSKDAIQRMLAQSDGIVGIVGEDGVSSFVKAEIESAVASAKPALAFVPESGGGELSPQQLGDQLPKQVRIRPLDLSSVGSHAIADLMKWK